MATFLTLPNELKLEVIENTAPDDIVNFALCCKSVYALAEKPLRQHKKDKKIYENLRFTLSWHDPDSIYSSGHGQLCALSRRQRLRLYPRAIGLNNYPYGIQDLREDGNPGVKEKIKLICDKIFQKFDSPYMDKSEMKTLFNKIADADRWAGNSMLLTLLPNVKRIYFDEYDFYDSGTINMISKISKTNEKASSSIQGHLSLTKLEEIQISSVSPSGNVANKSGVLEAFMTLPSLRVVRARDLTEKYTFSNWLYPDHLSNVTEIHFGKCTLAVMDLARLFQHLKALRIFSYHHLRDREDPTKEYGAGALIHELYTYAGKTLTFLSYTCDRDGNSGDDRWLLQTGTLSEFESLRTLRLSRTILTKDGVSQRLVEHLPSSLEELEIVDEITSNEARIIFDGLLPVKQERLPNLRLIVFNTSIPFDDEIVAAYESVGVMLDWKDPATKRIQKTHQRWLAGVECKVYWRWTKKNIDRV